MQNQAVIVYLRLTKCFDNMGTLNNLIVYKHHKVTRFEIFLQHIYHVIVS
jgi:hypothetical protein